jgi:hypothetical protein
MPLADFASVVFTWAISRHLAIDYSDLRSSTKRRKDGIIFFDLSPPPAAVRHAKIGGDRKVRTPQSLRRGVGDAQHEIRYWTITVSLQVNGNFFNNAARGEKDVA